ncbi:hypothetical protein FKM82_013235 [Ascaphus truei]
MPLKTPCWPLQCLKSYLPARRQKGTGQEINNQEKIQYEPAQNNSGTCSVKVNSRKRNLLLSAVYHLPKGPIALINSRDGSSPSL